ncbi:auxin canalization protein [Perilla frutescens var. hirtella]|uniref:Auxin canalization protein n=1 Tax=Perilla frutescens var. hirtella TaxID=608512 RepID=A0AAD4P404_PERFH|nr:auxin canalization protein [Perilla frutescens var. hirtella]
MALAKMDSDYNPTLSQAHPETMDFLSQAWCNFAVQAFQPETHDRSLVLQDSSIKIFDDDVKPPPSVKTNSSAKLDDGDKFLPPWKANDVKSWIWMQQAMHPEVNYNSYFKRKWMTWKLAPFKQVSIKKWVKEIKQRRKEEQRLQKAEVHAAISVAGVAAALAAIAADTSQHGGKDGNKESAVASAAALVAAQCAKVAEAMGAKREQLSCVIGSAISGTGANEIVTLTASAATSIRGADTLKARSACKNRLNGSSPVLPLEDSNEVDFNFEKCRSVLAKGADLNTETADGRYSQRSLSVVLNNEGKVVLKMKKLNILNAFARQKESIVLDWHAELYKDSEGGDTETGYLIVLTTNKGMVKLDMMNDYERYRAWSMTINHMMRLSTTYNKYELQFYKT